MPVPYILAHKPFLAKAVAQAPIQFTDDLGKYTLASASLLTDQGCERLAVNTRGWYNLQESTGSILRPASILLNRYKKVSALVTTKTAPWNH